MDINKLHYFRQVARMKSFTRAATELHIAQPALSKQIAHLEQELGTRLFDRLGRHTELTQAGRILLYHVERTLDEIERAKESIGELLRLGRGEIRLGTLASVSDYVLPHILAEFLKRYPNIDVWVENGSLDELAAQVLENKLDAAIVALPVIHHRLRSEIIFEEEFVLAVPADHPWASKKSVDLAQLDGQSLIVPPFNSWSRDFVGLVCEQHNVHYRIRAEIRSFEMIKRLVAEGVEMGLVPEIIMNETPPEIVKVRINNPRLLRQIAWVYHEGRDLSHALNELRSLIANRFPTFSFRATEPPSA
jgi:DNA-binding transcriptional LysR family regulator